MPEIGHLDPVFVGLMSKIQQLLRHVWQTKNQMTIPVSNSTSRTKIDRFAQLRNLIRIILVYKLSLGQRNW
jgi:aspartate aminotransferase-like enzyme